MRNIIHVFFIVLSVFIMFSCKKKDRKKVEQLTFNEIENESKFDSLKCSLNGTSTFTQLYTSTSDVLLTGIDHIRLLKIYKISPKTDKNIHYVEGTTYYDSYYNENGFKYFMPGIDIIQGYNMINIGHYNFENNQLSYFFQKPVLIKTLYFPGIRNDSLDKKPIKRNFFMVTVYDEDTNKDSLINKNDLRRMYFFDELNSKKMQLIPETHSAIRSTYDYKNDIMYIYARYDANRNGTPEKNEPINIYWIDLSKPTAGIRII